MRTQKTEFKIHSIKYNLLMNMILKISGFIFPLITFPYVSRILLSEGTGRIAFAQSVISYYTLVASLGIPAYGVRKCAQVREDNQALTKCVKELLIINSICMVISYLAFIVMTFTISKFAAEKELLFITSLTIVLNTVGVEWFYQAIEQYDYITIRNLAFKVVSIILMFAFVHEQKDYLIYGSISIVGSVGSNFLNFLRLHKYIDLRQPGKLDVMQHLKPIFTLFLYYAATTIYTNLDIVMLGFMTNDVETGYYNAAVKLKNVLVGAIIAIGSVSLPRASSYLASDKNDDFKRLISLSSNLILFLAIPLCVYFVINADYTIQVLSGDDFINAVPAMRIITPSIICIGITSITAYQLLIPLGKNNVTLLGAVAGALVDLIINMLLIPHLGAGGAAIGTLVAELIVLIIHFGCLKEYRQDIINLKEMFRIVIATAFGSIVVLLMRKIPFGNSFFQLLITGSVFAICYMTCSYVLKTNITTYILSEIKKRRKRS